MYKKTTTLPNIYSFVLNANKIYTYRMTTDTLQELSLEGDVQWNSKETNIWDYNVYKNYIIFNRENGNKIANDTYIYNRITKENWFHQKIILSNISDNNYYQGNILYSFEDNKVTLFNLATGKIDVEMFYDSKGVPSLITNSFLIEKKNAYIYIYSSLDFSFIGEVNIESLYSHQQKIKISQIKEYQNSLIVITSAGVLRLSTKDGSVIWKTFRYANTIEIVGNIGYICSGLALYKVNLDTGEESGYGWEYERLPDFIYNEKIFWPMGHRVIYHEGLLWYSVYSSGHSFLLTINPDNGNYEWIHHVDTYEKTEAPQFYEDKMFLWDTGNTLHIYEKE